MPRNLLEFALCLFAAYGLFSLILDTFDAMRARLAGRRPAVRVALLVRDAENHAEYIVRNAIKKRLATDLLSDGKLFIIDMNSTDNTYGILEKLEGAYPGIEILPYKDKEKVFHGFGVFSAEEK